MLGWLRPKVGRCRQHFRDVSLFDEDRTIFQAGTVGTPTDVVVVQAPGQQGALLMCTEGDALSVFDPRGSSSQCVSRVVSGK